MTEMKKTSHTFHFPLSLGEGSGVRLYFQQALYHLRENPVISWISVLGTALSICMIMVIVITLRVRIADCEPEVNRSRSLYVPNMSYRAKGDTSGSSANSSMSVQTGRECFKTLPTAEAVTLGSNPGKVRVRCLPVPR